MSASQMRRDAYTSGGHVPGPLKDPAGWFALPKATSFGMFSDDLGQRRVAIDCTVSIFFGGSTNIFELLRLVY